MTQTQSPVDSVSRQAVAGGLLAIGEPWSLAHQFAPAPPALAPGPDEAYARDELLRVAATPEQRRALAEAWGAHTPTSPSG